jgi:hypothetical protein
MAPLAYASQARYRPSRSSCIVASRSVSCASASACEREMAPATCGVTPAGNPLTIADRLPPKEFETALATSGLGSAQRMYLGCTRPCTEPGAISDSLMARTSAPVVNALPPGSQWVRTVPQPLSPTSIAVTASTCPLERIAHLQVAAFRGSTHRGEGGCAT